MTFSACIALALIGAILFFLADLALRRLAEPRVASVSLISRCNMAKAVVGVPKKFAAILRSDSGLVVDIGEFPQAFVDVSWTVGNADIAAVAPAQTEAEVLFSAPGVTTLTVSGTNKDGEAVSATIDIEAEAPTPKVVSVDIVEA